MKVSVALLLCAMAALSSATFPIGGFGLGGLWGPGIGGYGGHGLGVYGLGGLGSYGLGGLGSYGLGVLGGFGGIGGLYGKGLYY